MKKRRNRCWEETTSFYRVRSPARTARAMPLALLGRSPAPTPLAHAGCVHAGPARPCRLRRHARPCARLRLRARELAAWHTRPRLRPPLRSPARCLARAPMPRTLVGASSLARRRRGGAHSRIRPREPAALRARCASAFARRRLACPPAGPTSPPCLRAGHPAPARASVLACWLPRAASLVQCVLAGTTCCFSDLDLDGRE